MAAHNQVIIIGAGLSGVCAAKLLEENGVEVTVLEASDRIGGRLHTIQNDNVGYVDIGGAFVGPTQDRILKVIRELGLSTYKVHEKGDLIHYRKGRVSHFSGIVLPPMHSVAGFLDANNLLRELDRMGEEVPLDKPWDAPHAMEWDRMSFREWCMKNIWTRNAMACANLLVKHNLTAEPNEISLLWVLWYIKGAGGTARIGTTDGGAQERKVVGGTQQIPKLIAAQLKGDVHLNSPVCKIEYKEHICEVTTINGQTYTADHIILAIAPILQTKISFVPALTPVRNQLIQRMPMGCVIKTMTYYEKPYWREKGISGTCLVEDSDLTFPVEGCMDDCKPDGSFPCIIGFVLSEKAKIYGQLTVEERKDRIARSYAKIFGIAEMAKPVHYEEKDWSGDPWCGGCFTGFMPPGVMTQLGKSLREPIGGRIFMAGTETATIWSGYMDGAIQSGQRAAKEVLHQLGRITEENVWKDDVQEELPVPDLSGPAWMNYAPSVPGFLRLILSTGGIALTGFLMSRL